jgi:enamine deaminase RidA (YjgF/YER057c/UK114 family)
MRSTIFSWLEHEFVRVYGEGRVGLAVPEATRELLGRIGAELATHGLSLDDVVRTRLFARDRAGRDQGSAARREIMSNRARSSSTGVFAPAVFNSDAPVAVEVLAMRPRQAGAQKRLQEYDPPRTPLRYLVLESIFFGSGETGPGATLDEQVAAVMGEHGESLAHAGTSWERAVLISCCLQRSQSPAALRQALQRAAPVAAVPLECELVEGFAGEGRLVEIEVTALVG